MAKRISEKSASSKLKMVQTTAALFRENGFGSTGVDGIAKAADFTSGAFYFHFGSKLGAFVAAVTKGLQDLRAGIEQFQRVEGKNWLRAFTSFYLGFKRTCDLRDGCSVPLLSADVERAGMEARTAYQTEMLQTFELLQAGLTEVPGSLTRREQALAAMALLAGGVTLSRTVADPRLSEEISLAVQNAVDRITAPDAPRPST